MSRVKTVFVCRDCGAETPRWEGRCPTCGEWNSLDESRLKSVPRDAGGVNRAVVKEFAQVEVRDHLTVELIAKATEPSERQWPLLGALEIVRDDGASSDSPPEGGDRR